MRKKISYFKNEYYHIYNRGVDKRIIFEDLFDLLRFYQSMQEFNSIEPIGSIYINRNIHKKYKSRGATPTDEEDDRLVEIIAFCLNPNHYHLILTPLVEGGISEFMRRLNSGYTSYFNQKYKRVGALFQGTFKSVYIDSDSYLKFLSVYINLNFDVHRKFQNMKDKNGKPKKLFYRSSWGEYTKAKIIKGKLGEENQVINNENDICDKSMILSHFDSVGDYKKFAMESLKNIQAKRYKDEEVIKNNFSIGKKF
ncbi:transposase [Patescibacteria group bacterium]|nr:transposase [Patescibacteria group bacterium]